MTHRTAVSSDFESFLDSVYPSSSRNSLTAREAEVKDQQLRLEAFPFAVILKVSYPELDYANRWCWQQFGPADGDCLEKQSQYPTCALPNAHRHAGRWRWHWLAKTDYDFGYNEWSFAQEDDRKLFRAFSPHIQWGERFPK